ncbi:MAG: hypothetical protein WA733_04415, partial [Methylocystis sp.]
SSFFVIAKARKNQIPTPFLTRESRHDSQKSSRNRKIFRLSVEMSKLRAEGESGLKRTFCFSLMKFAGQF